MSFTIAGPKPPRSAVHPRDPFGIESSTKDEPGRIAVACNAIMKNRVCHLGVLGVDFSGVQWQKELRKCSHVYT